MSTGCTWSSSAPAVALASSCEEARLIFALTLPALASGRSSSLVHFCYAFSMYLGTSLCPALSFGVFILSLCSPWVPWATWGCVVSAFTRFPRTWGHRFALRCHFGVCILARFGCLLGCSSLFPHFFFLFLLFNSYIYISYSFLKFLYFAFPCFLCSSLSSAFSLSSIYSFFSL